MSAQGLEYPDAVVLRALILAGVLVLSSQTSTRKVAVFPDIDTVSGAPALSDFAREWYTRHLVAMSESRLPDGPGETYRFVWLRSFDHPIAIRVWCAGATCRLTGIRTSGRGGYEPGSIAQRRTRVLSATEVTSFQAMLSRAQFWGPAPEESPVRVDPDGNEWLTIHTDGAQWVLEGRRGPAYHLWDVRSPEASGPKAAFRELCLFLVRLSGLAVRQDQIY
jgi:hypothetical protein